MYLAGFHWCYKRPMQGYDDWGRFEREGRDLAVLDDHGEFIISDIRARTYLSGQKYFVPLCVGSSDTQELYFRNFGKLMDLGANTLQMDQQLGFYADVCYSEEHDHAPGYGAWMYEKPLDFIRRVRKAVKDRDPQGVFAAEAPCEVWIQELDFTQDRPYGLNSIPLFEYLYHEYAPAYGGEGTIGVWHPEYSVTKHAMVFTQGIRSLFFVNETEYDFEVNPEYPALVFLRNICGAQRSFARDYVVFGRMRRPTGLGVGSVRMDLFESHDTIDMPRVFHSVWESPDGKTGYVLANWTGEVAEVVLSLACAGGEVSVVSRSGREPAAADEARTGKIALSVGPRDVLVVEQQ
jgi:hypothetical protein